MSLYDDYLKYREGKSKDEPSLSSSDNLYDRYRAYKKGKSGATTERKEKEPDLKTSYLSSIDDSDVYNKYKSVLSNSDFGELSQYNEDAAKFKLSDLVNANSGAKQVYKQVNYEDGLYGNHLGKFGEWIADSMGLSYGAGESLMTDNEKSIFNYFVNTGDLKTANEYYYELADTLYKRSMELQKYKTQSEIQDYGDVAAKSASSVIPSVASGLGQIIGGTEFGIASAINGEGFGKGWTDYAQYDAVGANVDTVRGTSAAKIAEDTAAVDDTWIGKAAKNALAIDNIPSWLYQNAMSQADSAASRLISLPFAGVSPILGEAISLSSLGGTAARQQAIAALEAGATEEEAFASSISAGLIEAATEKIGYDNAFDIMTGKMKANTARQFILRALGSSVLAEGAEEGTSTIANAVANYFIFDTNNTGAKSDWAKVYDQYRANGMSDAEAKKAVVGDLAKQAAGDALGGALGGLVSGGESAAVNAMGYGETGSAIKKNERTADLIEQAKATGNEGLAAALEKNPSKANLGYAQEKLVQDAYEKAKKKDATADDLANYVNAVDKAESNMTAKSGVTDKKGNPLHVISIDWNGDTPVLKTKEGDYKASEVQITDSARNFFRFTENIPEDRRDVFVQNFHEGMNLGDYIDAFDVAYEYGRRGFSSDANKMVQKGTLTSEQVHNIYAAGLAAEDSVANKLNAAQERIAERRAMFPDRKVRAKIDDSVIKDYSKLTENQRKNVVFAEAIAKGFNVNIKLFDSKNETGDLKGKNGAYLAGTNTIMLDINATNTGAKGDTTNAITTTLSHELTHWAKANAPTLYKQFRQEMLSALAKENNKFLTKKSGTDFDIDTAAFVKEQGDLYYEGLSQEEVEDELIARACENMLSNSEYAQHVLFNLSEEDRKTLIDKIKDFFKRLKEALDSIMGRYDSKSRYYQLLAKDAEALSEMQAAWDEMVEQAAENSGYANEEIAAENFQSDANSPMMYSINADFAADIDAWAKAGMPDGVIFTLGTTSDIIKKLGAKDTNIYMTSDKINLILGNTTKQGVNSHKEMTLDEIKKIPSILEDPSLVLTSSTTDKYGNNSRILTYGNALAQNKKPFFAILDLRPTDNGVAVFDMQRVVNAYTKTNPIQQVRSFLEKSKILYIDTRKAVTLLHSLGFSYPKLSKIGSSYMGSITYGPKVVNITGKDFTDIIQLVQKDSTGKELSDGQAKYFDDSKIRDKKENLLLVYHGTPTGGFTVFRNGLTYFTADKSYAAKYVHHAGSGRNGNAPQIYEGYLNIVKPFTLADKTAKKIFIDEYIKGGYALGINPLASDAEIENYIAAGIDWNEADDLKSFLDEKGYDYDGMILNEGGVPGTNGPVMRGDSYVIFSPEQFKRSTNLNPTNNVDMDFSMKSEVEEIGDLVAVHNMHEAELLETLKLGGFPMPSIAVMKSNDAGQNSQYGEVSVVFSKDTIDPKKNRANKVYNGDAWTPSFPQISYKISDKEQKKIEDKVRKLVGDDLYSALNPALDYANMEDKVNRFGSPAKSYEVDAALKAAYLADNGKAIDPVTKTKDYGVSREGLTTENIKKLLDTLEEKGINVADYHGYDFFKEHEDLMELIRKAVNDNYQEKYARYFEKRKEKGLDLNDELYSKDDWGFGHADGIMRKVSQMQYDIENGGIPTVIDKYATEDRINELVPTDDKAYQSWLEDLFKSAVEKKGLRNDKDLFTNTGNRRSWDALHWEVTLENIVKAMKKQGTQGIGMLGYGSPYGASAKELTSISDIRAHKGQLQAIDEKEYNAIKEKFTDRFSEIADRYTKSQRFGAKGDAGAALCEAIANSNSKASLKAQMQKDAQWFNYSDELVDDLWDLVTDIQAMPTGYFEAKPQRAVGLNEVYSVIVPDNAKNELKNALADNGVRAEYYKAGDESDRLDKLNNMKDAFFSNKEDDDRVFYTHNTEVVKNPTSAEYRQMREEILNEKPWLRGRDEVLLRRTFDEDGNEYYWDASKGLHSQIEPEINKRYNTRTSQQWEWWKRDDKDDYPLAYSWKDDNGYLHLDNDDILPLEDLEQYLNKVQGRNARIEAHLHKLNQSIKDNVIINAAQLDNFAKKIKEQYGLYGSKKEIAEKLKEVFKKSTDIKGFNEAAEKLAKEFINDSAQRDVDPTLKAEADRLKKELRTYKFSMNDKQRQEMKYTYGANWSQKLLGKLSYRKDGIPLDDLWNTLVSEYPTIFEEMGDAGQAVRIVELIDNLYSGKFDGFAWDRQTKEERQTQLKDDIREASWNIADNLTMAEKYSEAMRELRERMANLQAEVSKDAQRQRLIAKIVERENKLATMFRKNDKENHIPDVLKAPLKELFESVNIEAKVSTATMAKNFAALADAMQNVVSSDDALADMAMYFDTDGYFMNEVRDIAAEVQAKVNKATDSKENVSILDLSLESLTKLNEALTAISSAVRNYDRVLASDTQQRISDRTQSSMEFVSGIPEIAAKSGMAKVISSFVWWDNVTPVYGYDRFGKGGTDTFKGIMEGDDQLTRNSETIIKEAKKMFTADEAEAWAHEVNLVDIGGKEYNITTAQIMSLYCLSKRKAAQQHLYTAQNVYGEEIEGQGIVIGAVDKTSERTRPIKVTKDDVKMLCDYLTDRQKEVADQIQHFLSTTCSDWGNYVTMKRFGIMQFGEDNYFPMKVFDGNRASMPAEIPQQASIFKLLNMGFTKSLNERGNGALELSSIFDVFIQHSSEMAAYNAFALPILDAYKWLSYTELNKDGTRNSFKTAIEHAYGSDGLNFIMSHLEDLNGLRESVTSAEKLAKTIIRHYKTAATAANMRVVLMQPTAYLRAFNCIDGKYLSKAIDLRPSAIKAAVAEMNEKSALAQKKNGLGAFDTNISRSLAEQALQVENRSGFEGFKEKAMDKALFLAGKADEITWGTLYKAVQLEIKDKDPSLEGEAFDKAVNERFRDVCYRTQVFDSINARSRLMRKKDVWHQTLTAFASEPTLSWSMLSNEVFMYTVDARDGNKNAAWEKHAANIKRAFVSFLLTAISVSAVAAIPDWMRDDDDKKSFAETYAKNFGLNLLGEVTGLLPYMRDIYSVLVDGYDPSRPDEEILTSLRKEFAAIGNAFKQGKVTYRSIYQTAKLFSQATGLPIGNVVRDFKALWNKTVGKIFGITIS